MGGCQLMGHLHTLIFLCPICLYTPYIFMPPYSPVHLYVLLCSPYVMGFRGICTLDMTWIFLGLSVGLSGILVIVSTSIAFQFITVMLVAPYHCGLLPYWTGYLWMSVMLLFLYL